MSNEIIRGRHRAPGRHNPLNELKLLARESAQHRVRPRREGDAHRVHRDVVGERDDGAPVRQVLVEVDALPVGGDDRPVPQRARLDRLVAVELAAVPPQRGRRRGPRRDLDDPEVPAAERRRPHVRPGDVPGQIMAGGGGFNIDPSIAGPPPPPFTAYAPTGTAASATSAAPVTATRRRRSASPRRRIAG